MKSAIALADVILIVLVCLTCLILSPVVGAAEPYQEPYRPQFHFTPEKNWMNDPNGMFYYQGEYHLFYQYNPFGNKWGHMSWGHAVSPDLVHWEHLPVALQEQEGVMIFSGSAVVDYANTSRFGKLGKPPLVAIYTGHRPADKRQFQALAFSNDRGRTWTKYQENPVLDIYSSDFRDPKVFWHEASDQWVMVVSLALERKILFYGSPDLKHWRPLSEFGPAGLTSGIWECPDMFPLPVEGTEDLTRWVLVVNVGSGAPAGGSGCQYFIGFFDGRTFHLDEKAMPKAELEFVPEGRLLADFESGYGDWTTTGEAFGDAPASGKLQDQQEVKGFRGKGLVNSFRNGDPSTGTLRSPTFEVTHDHIHFLIGGGSHEGRTCINLLVDDKVVRTATGMESEHLSWQSWEVKDLKNRSAILEIVDQETGGWGHLNVDHILMSNDRPRPARESVLWADYGSDFYAAVSWSDIPKTDGRRIWIGWMSNWQYAQDVPTSPWRSAMTVPRTLTLRKTTEGLRMVQRPVKELSVLRGNPRQLGDQTLEEANAWLRREGPWKDRLEIQLRLRLSGGSHHTGLRFQTALQQEVVVGFEASKERLYLDRTKSGEVSFHPKFGRVHTAPLKIQEGLLDLRLLVDASSMEVFASDGQVVLTDLFFPSQPRKDSGLKLFSNQTPSGVRVESLKIWDLESVW